MQLSQLRHDYQKFSLSEHELAADPLTQCQAWLTQAIKENLPHPNAMTLATLGADLQPHARIVLLKDLNAEGLSFYTNSLSCKGQDIAANDKVSLLFYWPEFERQIRIEGQAIMLGAELADAYFASRPRMSQLSAWASEQSQVVASREALVSQQQQYELAFKDQAVPRPNHWVGYSVKPHYFEFWQGRPDRLHDRLCYSKTATGPWDIKRLAP